MNDQVKTIQFDSRGLKFESTQFPCMASLGLLNRIQKTGGMSAEVMPPDLIADLLVNTCAYVGAGSNLKRVELTSQAAIDGVFSGRGLMLLFDVLAKVIELNYGDFGDGDKPASPTLATTPAQ